MRKKFAKWIAGVMLTVLTVSSIPADMLYAAADAPAVYEENENNEDGENSVENNRTDISNQEQRTENIDDAENQESAFSKEDNEITENDQSKAGEKTDQKREEKSAEEVNAGNLNFVYVESPYLETPGTQRIVFFFDSPLTGAENLVLNVTDSGGNLDKWELSKQEGSLYLFEKEYPDSTLSDTYKAASLIIEGKDGENILDLSKLNVDVEFGVNKEYAGLDQLQAVSNTNMESEIETSVVSIDENSVNSVQDDIASALQSAEQNKVKSRAQIYSSGVAPRRSDSENIVVALDPGHDNNDAGAEGYGLKEQELTLKIANYCKEELEKYSGVTVYMTRTTNTCPYDCSNSGECIQKRVNAAKKAGADIFVSFHLNSADATSANGAEVIIPNKNWKPALGAEGQELAEEILAQLVKLGLTERSIYSKDSLSGDKYTDGSLADYFAVPRMCKAAGITGIIVEHAFISNSGDVNKFLKTESGLRSLGVADANGIVKYYGLQKDAWAKPVLKSPTATYLGTNISWNSVTGATGYAVYRKTGTENWKMIDTTTSASYTDSSVLTNGRTYYYTVRAYRGSEKEALGNKYSSTYWTSFDPNGVRAIYVTAPSINNMTTADSGIKLSWTAISGVSGYAVYRKTADGSWGMIGTTSSTSYTDQNNLKGGTDYYYTLRAYTGTLSTAQSNKYNAAYWSGYDNSGMKSKYIAEPVLRNTTASSLGTVISWKPVSGASGYAVYRKAAGGNWATIDMTSSTSYTDTDQLTNGATYYYTVRAYSGDRDNAEKNRYNSDCWSYFDATGIKAVYINTPSLLATTTAQSGIKVSWNAVSGVSGYAVYRKTPSTDWGMIATTTSASFTDKSGMKNGNIYYYTVRAYKGSVNTANNNKYSAQYWSGYNAAGIQGKYISVPVLSGEKASAAGRTISWKPVSGAAGYAVYRKVSGGSWATIGLTTSTAYTDTAKLTNGKNYYYTVRAYTGDSDKAEKNRYNSNYWGYFDTSGIKTAYMSIPVLDTAVKQDTGIRVTWDAVSGASGYAVYRKAPGGDWGMIAATTSTSYTDKNSGSTIYSYTVRAYRGTLTTANANKYSSVYWSGFDNTGIKISDLSTPMLKSAEVVNNGICISWESVDNASGYAIYRKTLTTDWKMIDTVNAATYVDTNAGSSGTVYYYTVRAYRGDVTTAITNKYNSLYWSYFDTAGVYGSAYEIEGVSSVSIKQMTDFYNTYSPVNYPADELGEGGAPTISALAQVFYEEARDEEIKPEVVWCQTMLETGFLKFEGDVDISQYNFAGIGAVGNGIEGASFANVREGVRAQVQHMKAYASATITKDTLKHELADPRFHLVIKGSAKYVEILGSQENPNGNGWASDIGYGMKIMSLIRKLKMI